MSALVNIYALMAGITFLLAALGNLADNKAGGVLFCTLFAIAGILLGILGFIF